MVEDELKEEKKKFKQDLFFLVKNNWKFKTIVAVVIPLLDFLVYFGIQQLTKNTFIWFLIPAVLTIFVLMGLTIISLVKRCEYLWLYQKNFKSVIDTLGEYIGYKREDYEWHIKIDSDGSCKEKEISTIKSLKDNIEIILSSTYFHTNPKLSEKNKKELQGNFIDQDNCSEHIDGLTRISGSTIIRIAKFETYLPAGKSVKIVTKEINYPKGLLDASNRFERIKKEGGKLVEYVGRIPCEKATIRIEFPANTKMCPLECLDKRYYGVTPTDTENFMPEKRGEFKCIWSKKNNSETNNIVEVEILQPKIGVSYVVAWKYCLIK